MNIPTEESKSQPQEVGASLQRLPLVVDLDGTLTPSDTLIESLVGAVRHCRRPMELVRLLASLLRGRAAFKAEVSRLYGLPVERLPFRAEFVDWLRTEQSGGRRVVMATAANIAIAEKVSAHLGIFSEVIASNSDFNLKGPKKLEAIERTVGREFVYAGDSVADLSIWARAQAAVLVGASASVAKRARALTRIEREFSVAPPVDWRAWARGLRIHQWLKNLLLFVPLLTSHSLPELAHLRGILLAFVSLSVIASATYIANDVWDLESDRQHPRKRSRPFASGRVDLRLALLVMLVLLAAGLAIAWQVSAMFLVLALVYLVTTSVYSWVLKARPLLDLLTLAALYTLRVVAGAVAINVYVSSWLLAFSMFMFLSLALVKRCSELVSLRLTGNDLPAGRDYRVSDLEVLWPMGLASAMAAVVVFGLFISAPETASVYRVPQLLWLAALALVYWLSRLWIKTSRGQMHDDPLVYALRDRGSRVTLIFVAGCVCVARFATMGGATT